MKKEPVLVIMAAGMGSRYGGLKQIDPVDDQGHIIIDFSIYDALKAGFKKLVFIIKKEIEEDFKAIIGRRMEKHAQVEYVFQSLDALPEGFSKPADRVKPWGTGHAILSCKGIVDAPFAVINADDFYGAHAFKVIYDYLANVEDDDKYRYTMVGYVLENTLTEHGHVARGVCQTDESGFLTDVHERTRIEKRGNGAAYTEDEGATWVEVSPKAIVSMNLWGFTPGILDELDKSFVPFLKENMEKNPLKCEYFLPTVVNDLVAADRATVKVLTSGDRWYGVTYKEDKAVVVAAVKAMKDNGQYPAMLWED